MLVFNLWIKQHVNVTMFNATESQNELFGWFSVVFYIKTCIWNQCTKMIIEAVELETPRSIAAVCYRRIWKPIDPFGQGPLGSRRTLSL